MPSSTRGRVKNLYTAVRLYTGQPIYYVWKSHDIGVIPEVGVNDLTALGHEAVDAASTTNLYFYRASAPKPRRATKILNVAEGSATSIATVSSFVATDKLVQAAAAGWRVTGAFRRLSLGGSSTVAVTVELERGYQYAWNLNKNDYTSFKDAFGFEELSALTVPKRQKACRGSTFPKPRKAGKGAVDGGKFETFAASANLDDLQTAGWTLSGEEKSDPSYFTG